MGMGRRESFSMLSLDKGGEVEESCLMLVCFSGLLRGFEVVRDYH